MRLSGVPVMLILLALALISEPVWATSMGSTSPWSGRSPAECFCMSYGGCPRDGYCYFPDGSYYDLWAFYNGTVPTRASIEQAMWEAEMYAWLRSDDVYYPGYQPYGYPPSGYYYPAPYWAGYRPYSPDPLSPVGLTTPYGNQSSMGMT